MKSCVSLLVETTAPSGRRTERDGGEAEADAWLRRQRLRDRVRHGSDNVVMLPNRVRYEVLTAAAGAPFQRANLTDETWIIEKLEPT
jgi:hypothetical protein